MALPLMACCTQCDQVVQCIVPELAPFRQMMYMQVFRRTAIMNSDIPDPINLGSSEAVTVNQLVDIVEEIAGIKLKRRYDLSAPKGVNGRNSDNARIQELLHWEPDTSLRNGLEKTYRWIYDQYLARERGEAGVVRESFAASN
jgi:dTDP-D-glucose 4,6-dehydratase